MAKPKCESPIALAICTAGSCPAGVRYLAQPNTECILHMNPALPSIKPTPFISRPIVFNIFDNRVLPTRAGSRAAPAAKTAPSAARRARILAKPNTECILHTNQALPSIKPASSTSQAPAKPFLPNPPRPLPNMLKSLQYPTPNHTHANTRLQLPGR